MLRHAPEFTSTGRLPRPGQDRTVVPGRGRLRLQATAGNRAVSRMLAVQRCGGEVHDGCACAGEVPAVQREAAPHGAGRSTVQRFTDGTPDSPSAELPPGSAYAGMPGDLLGMLGRTLVAKAYWHWVNTRPTNLGAALDALGTANLNTLAQLHTKLVAA